MENKQIFVLGLVTVQVESRYVTACVKAFAGLVARTSELNSGGYRFKFRPDRWLVLLFSSRKYNSSDTFVNSQLVPPASWDFNRLLCSFTLLVSLFRILALNSPIEWGNGYLLMQ